MFSKIVLATRNPGKVREFQKLFDGFPVTVVPESDFNVASPVESGTTFVENAIIKARPAAVKGAFLKSVVVSSTMGPGVKINTVKLLNM